MKIVFVSDTHGDEDVLKKIVDFSKGYDAIICCWYKRIPKTKKILNML